MFSLIITLIAVSLVALLAGATAYFGGSAFTEGGAKSEVARYTNGAQQVQASSALYISEFQKLPGTVADLVDAQYLAEEPWPKGAWQFSDGFVETPGHMAQAPCEVLMARVSNGTVPETRQAGLHEQCYGTGAPYTYAYMAAGVFSAIGTDGVILPGDQIALRIGGSGSEGLRSVIPVSDGYVAAGHTPIGGYHDGLLIKFDVDGNRIWSRTVGAGHHDFFNSVTEVSDGYIAAGQTYISGYGANYHGLVVKFDFDGNPVWSRKIGGYKDDIFYSVIEVSDGYVAAGYSESTGAPYDNGWLVKFDFDGNRVWSLTLGGGDLDRFYSVIEISDGLVAAGFKKEGANYDGWLVKFDFDGNRVWSRSLHGGYPDYFKDVAKVSDGYVAVGHTRGTSTNGWVVKFDLDGNKMWSKTFGASGGYDYFDAVTPVSDGYVAAGYTSASGSGNNDGWLMKFDFDGNVVWSRTLGGTNNDDLYALASVSEGHLAVGMTQNFGSAGNDGWLVRLTDDAIDGCLSAVKDWSDMAQSTQSWSTADWNKSSIHNSMTVSDITTQENTQDWTSFLYWTRTSEGDTLICPE